MKNLDIDALLKFHHSQFGDARMEEKVEPTAEETAATDAAAKAATEAAALAKAEDVSALPPWAQKVISDTRREAGDNRVAKTVAEKAAADNKAIVDAINAALNPGAAADPTKLAEQLAATTTGKREAELMLDVFKSAMAAGANPVLLMDRNSFMTAVKGLDPADSDYSKKVTAAVTAAVAADPTLKAARVAGSSAVDHGAGGSGEGGARPKSIKEALSKAP